jgi:tRNA (mo5U34)-methyltransferase
VQTASSFYINTLKKMNPEPQPIPRVDSQGRVATPRVDVLSDEELQILNDLLPWQCFTLDLKGRRLGKAASATKREIPQEIPDHRIEELNRRVPLAGRHVLEVGCFEGVHTVALAAYGAKVTAVDSRIENLVKTMTRLWAFGYQADVFRCDVEAAEDFARVPEVDITHHVGVLYHLVDPVGHLRAMLARTRNAIMLDTHVAREGQADASYDVQGRSYPYWRFRETGRAAAFAGMYDHAKWLPLETLRELLQEGGFAYIDVAEVRDERNGARALIYATR